jgi:hypothetical protein
MYKFLLFSSIALMIVNLVFSITFSLYLVSFVSLFLGAFFVFLLFKKMKTVTIQEKDVKGLLLGQGVDIDNPEELKNVTVTLDDEALNLGALFIGGPGSGKSVAACLLKQYFTLQRKGCGYAYFEGKGDFDIYQMDVVAAGQPDYFFSSELPSSDSINLLDAPASSVVDYLTRVLVGTSSEYYGAAQSSVLRKVIPFIKSFDSPANLMDLWAILTVDDAQFYMLARAEKEGVDPDIISTAKQYFSQDKDERLKVIDGLLNKLYPFVSGVLKDRVNAYEPTLNLSQAVTEGKRIYFHMPLSEDAKVVATILTEQFGVIATKRQLDTQSERKPYPLNFDDWGAFFYGNFGAITARCRSAKMPISFFFQSRAQTDKVESGGAFTTEITDNIGTLIALRINGPDTSKWMSEQFGTYEGSALSRSNSTNSDGDQLTLTEKPRVKPEAFKDLNKGEAYINVFLTAKGGIMQNKRYKVRFPLPQDLHEKPNDWPQLPTGKNNNDCDGLNLWRDFMNETTLKELKKQVIEEALSDNEIEEVVEIEDEEIEEYI